MKQNLNASVDVTKVKQAQELLVKEGFLQQDKSDSPTCITNAALECLFEYHRRYGSLGVVEEKNATVTDNGGTVVDATASVDGVNGSGNGSQPS